jgi:glycosyltransferase involved in cell wall biosynthesis
MPKIMASYNDVKLVIAGRGGMTDELKNLSKALGVEHKVYFTGYLNAKQVTKMYKCADISVFPSTYEPFGIVVLEAMCAGVPVVVSDIGGLNEIVSHTVDGMKSYTGNPNSICDSILTLLYNPQLCSGMIKKARAKVKTIYNWTKIAQDTYSVYQKSINQTVAQRAANEAAQEKAHKHKTGIINLIDFKRRSAYA